MRLATRLGQRVILVCQDIVKPGENLARLHHHASFQFLCWSSMRAPNSHPLAASARTPSDRWQDRGRRTAAPVLDRCGFGEIGALIFFGCSRLYDVHIERCKNSDFQRMTQSISIMKLCLIYKKLRDDRLYAALAIYATTQTSSKRGKQTPLMLKPKDRQRRHDRRNAAP
jgi:hypothetical protein